MDFGMKLSKNEKILLMAAGIGIAAGAAVYFITREMKKRRTEDEDYIHLDIPASDEEIETSVESDKEVSFNCAESTALSYEDAYNIAVNTAKAEFGENPLVVSASEKKAMYVNIDGIMRPCYMFGADKMGLTEGAMHGLYHVDADTGEVFDSSGGMMRKIN